MRLFIGFTGVKQAGKSTAYSFIKERFPEVQEIALANKLKNVCSEVFGIPRKDFDDPATKEKELEKPIYLDANSVAQVITQFGFTPDEQAHVRDHVCKVLHTPREVAQYIGTEVLRTVSENVHCHGSVLGLPEHGIFVVTDIRFPNEYDFFRNLEGAQFYPHYICNYGAETKSQQDSHASEKHILTIAKKCATIDNNGTLEDLRNRVQARVAQILEEQKVGLGGNND